MTREDTMKILATIQAAYPNYKPNDKTAALNTWWTLLQEYPYEQVSLALKAYIQTDTSGFAPAVGQVIAQIQKITQAEVLNEMEAWALVSRALRNGYYGAEKEFDRLPPLIREAVGSPDNLRNWSQSALDSIETVVQSNFLRTYRAVVEREKEYNRVSGEIRFRIDAMREGKQKYNRELPAPEEQYQLKEDAVPMPEKLQEKLTVLLGQEEKDA